MDALHFKIRELFLIANEIEEVSEVSENEIE